VQRIGRQVPPRKPSFSRTTVFRPHGAARMAVTCPPGPLPMMARSYLGKRLSSPAGGTTLDFLQDLGSKREAPALLRRPSSMHREKVEIGRASCRERV